MYINWDEIYYYLKTEKYNGVSITGPQIIRQLKDINQNNRILFLEYHRYKISNLPKCNDIYTKTIENTRTGRTTEIKIEFKDGNIDTDDAPIKRHNFSNDLDYQNYINGYALGNIKIVLDSYKGQRKHIIRFLLHPVINNIDLIGMEQPEFNEYLNRMVNQVEVSKLDNHLIQIKEYFIFHKCNMKNKITFGVNNSKIDIPRWNIAPATIQEANEEQLEFYNYWLSNYKDNVFIDIHGVLDYLLLYIYNIVYDFIQTKDILKITDEFVKIDKSYGHYKKIKTSLYSYFMDAYLWIGNYAKHLECKIKNYMFRNEIEDNSIDVENIITRVHKSDDKDSVCDAFFLVMRNKDCLTEFGLSNLGDVIRVTEMYLKSFKLKKGVNIKNYFYNKFDFWNLSEYDFSKLREYIVDNDLTKDKNGNYKTKLEYFEVLKLSHIRMSKQINEDIKSLNKKILNSEKYSLEKRENFEGDKSYSDYLKEQINYAKEKLFDLEYNKSHLFISLPHNYKRNCYVYSKRVPQIIDTAFSSKEASIVRECENIFREEKGIPKIGEGWISETNLYRQILDAFPDEKIVHHGTPFWLGRQHLDIYFPEKNIGIEYQGAQHNEPVEYFGGVKGYIEQQKRDGKKKELCKKNNCSLIYVYPDYNFEDIKEKIKKLL